MMLSLSTSPLNTPIKGGLYPKKSTLGRHGEYSLFKMRIAEITRVALMMKSRGIRSPKGDSKIICRYKIGRKYGPVNLRLRSNLVRIPVADGQGEFLP